MSSGLLTLFKYGFLAVLYLFFLRVLRAVWVELREPKIVSLPSAAIAAPLEEAPAPSRAEAAATTAVAISSGRTTPAGALEITAPPERQGQRFDLGEELTVGRAPGCGVSLPEDTFVSQVHARIFRRDGQYYVEDLGSTNGTSLNDRRVSAPVLMRKGDVLTVGRTTLELAQ